MADVSIDGTISTSTARGCRGLVFVNSTKGYFFYIDSGGTFVYSKTTDGGATWGAAVTINSATTQVAYDVWFDQWTPGDLGTLIHCWYFDVTNDKLFWRSLDTTSDTLGTERTCFTGASAVAGNNAYVSGTKAVSGYLYACTAIDASNEQYFGRSTDSGTTWSAALSATFQEANPDHALLFPASGTGDNNDIWAIYHDSSATALTMKMWDSSAVAQVESSTVQTIIAVGTDITLYQYPYSGSIRLSDGALILVSCSDRDTATSDMQCWVVTGVTAASLTGITAKTDITTNIDDNYHPQTFIDQSTNNIYVAYNGKRDGTETLGTTTKVYYTKSTDGGTTWTAGDTAYMEGAAGVIVQTWSSISGTRFYVAWRVAGTSLGNKVSSLTFPFVYRPTGALPFVGTPALKTSRTLTAALAATGSGIGVQTDSDSFTRANEDPLVGNWTVSDYTAGQHFKLETNRINSSSVSGNDDDAYWNTWSHGNDQYSQAAMTVSGSGTNAGPGVLVRKATSASTHTSYRCVINDTGAIELAWFNAGSKTQLATRSVTYVAGKKLGLRIIGTTLTIWYDGVQQGASVTDTNISSGSPGITLSTAVTSFTIDDWDAGTAPVDSPGLSGSLAKTPGKSLSGALNFVGSITRKTLKALSGTLSLLPAFRYPWRQTAALSFSGSAVKKTIPTTKTGTLSFVGSVTKKSIRSFLASLGCNYLASYFDSSLTQLDFENTTRHYAECFHCNQVVDVDSISVVLSKSGTPAGNVTCSIYDYDTGTYGVNAIPLNPALATTDPIAATSLSTTSAKVIFTLGTKYTLSANKDYFVSVDYANATSFNWISVYTDIGVAPAGERYGGNMASAGVSGVWTSISSGDMYFGVSVANPLTKRLNRLLSATLNFSGSIAKTTLRGLAAALSFIGSIATQYIPGGTLFLQSLAGTLSFIGSQSKSTLKSLSGSLSFIGSLAKAVSRSLPGTLSFIGSITKQDLRALSGTLSFIGTRVSTSIHALIGTLSLTGSQTKRASKSLSGTLSFVGSVFKFVTHPVGGTLSFIGSATKKTLRSISGALSFVGSITASELNVLLLTATLSFAGTVSKRTSRSLSGLLSFIGTLSKFSSRLITATLSFSGSLTKKTLKSLSGALSFIGTAVNSTRKSLTGAMSFAGSIARTYIFSRTSLTASLPFVGSIFKQSRKSFSGVLSFIGSFAKRTLYPLAATLDFIGDLATLLNHAGAHFISFGSNLDFAGSLNKFTARLAAASLSFTGSISRRMALAATAFTASLSFIGAAIKSTRRSIAGALSFIGSLSTAEAIVLLLEATLSFVGSTSKSTRKVAAGSLSFIGSIAKQCSKAITASMNFIGGLTKQTRRALSGVLSFIGSLTTSEMILVALSASLNFVGNATKRTSKSLSGYLDFIGNISRAIVHTLSGTLNFIGSIYRAFPVNLESTLSFIGEFTGGLVSHVFYVLIESALLLAGGINRSIFRPFIAYLLISGELNKFTSRVLDGVLSFVHRLLKLASFNKIVDTQLLKPPLFTAQAIKSPIAISATVLKRTGIQAF